MSQIDPTTLHALRASGYRLARAKVASTRAGGTTVVRLGPISAPAPIVYTAAAARTGSIVSAGPSYAGPDSLRD